MRRRGTAVLVLLLTALGYGVTLPALIARLHDAQPVVAAQDAIFGQLLRPAATDSLLVIVGITLVAFVLIRGFNR